MTSRQAMRSVERESFRIVPETCPAVDAAMEAATNEIKKQTIALRDALVEKMIELREAQEKIDDLESLVRELKDEIDRMRVDAWAVRPERRSTPPAPLPLA
jgi:hypothetical protein